MKDESSYKPVVVSGVLLGLGLGGFFDGIVLHQILQWHHMLTSAGYPANTVENLEINTLADGLFHAATYLFTISGLVGLWRAVQHRENMPDRILVGALLVGWGLFNLIEGIIDHHILAIHHVRSGPNQLWWDIGFLIWGALMLVGGWLLIRSAQENAAASTTEKAEQLTA